jgi:hypothetical protein
MTVRPRGSMPAILRGMGLIARGRPEGLNCFGDSQRAIMTSLIPGIGIIVGAVVEGVSEGEGLQALGEMLMPICALLGPMILSYELARWWGRDAFWGKFIVAFNWCQWVLPLVAMVLTAAFSLMHAAGLINRGAFPAVIVILGLYALWMNWFLVRHGLALSPGRAALFVAGVNVGTMALIVVPTLLGKGWA